MTTLDRPAPAAPGQWWRRRRDASASRWVGISDLTEKEVAVAIRLRRRGASRRSAAEQIWLLRARRLSATGSHLRLVQGAKGRREIQAMAWVGISDLDARELERVIRIRRRRRVTSKVAAEAIRSHREWRASEEGRAVKRRIAAAGIPSGGTSQPG